jgi:hypothetical protein
MLNKLSRTEQKKRRELEQTQMKMRKEYETRKETKESRLKRALKVFSDEIRIINDVIRDYNLLVPMHRQLFYWDSETEITKIRIEILGIENSKEQSEKQKQSNEVENEPITFAFQTSSNQSKN